MTEPRQSETAPRVGRFRFSLRGLFLLVLVAGVTFSHAAASLKLKKIEAELANAHEELGEAYEELQEVTSENEEFRGRLAELRSAYPDQLCVVASPFFRQKDLRWRWQVVAPGASYRLCAAVQDIPEEGVPTHGGQVLVPQLPRGECSIEAILQENHSGEWQLHVKCISVDSRFLAFKSVEISIDVLKPLGDSLARSEDPPVSHATSSWARRDRPAELLRTILVKQHLPVSRSPAKAVGEGIMLWIEKDRRTHDSELPPASP